MAKRYTKFSDKGRCRFCRAKTKAIDYKNIDSLKRLCTTQGKMFSRKRSGNCARHQRQAMVAIKRARYIALLPYTG
jgi:small subunit ribosomal protein S18